MRLRIDVGWLHVDVSLGPDEDEDEDEQRYTDLGSDTERADEHAHDRAEMDVRRPSGFRSHPTTRAGGAP